MPRERWSLRCIGCGRRFPSEPPTLTCTDCGSLLELSRPGPPPTFRELTSGDSRVSVWRYSAALPPCAPFARVTLNEGGTPLIRSSNLGGSVGLSHLHVKFEGLNPTGSFKDRGMTVTVSRAKSLGARVLVCASTGNTSASLAAYAARARMLSVVALPSGKVAAGKLTQAVVYGSRVLRVAGGFDEALALAMKASSEVKGVYLVNSLNPYRIEGQKTVAYEIYEQLGGTVPDCVVLPVGNAGNISAAWKGFKELSEWGIARSLPKMIGVQAEGASPIARAVAQGADRVEPWEAPETIASAIRIGNPVSWRKALRAIRDSGGTAITVTDDEILAARNNLAKMEGVFAEPASAAPIAALPHLKKHLSRNDIVVCIATGNGLKDQGSVKVDVERTPVVSDVASFKAALAL